MEALRCMGELAYRAMVRDGKVDFSVSSVKSTDGSLILTVLHTSGTLQFVIPKEEREAAAGMSAHGA